MDFDKELRKETKKWLKKIKEERKGIKLVKEMETSDIILTTNILTNIDAYINDATHFLGKGVPIKAFEAVIYAYGLLDAIKMLKIAQTNPH